MRSQVRTNATDHRMHRGWMLFSFLFNDTATTEIYTLSLHDALPICGASPPRTDRRWRPPSAASCSAARTTGVRGRDRKSTRLNSSHSQISYAVFCLKKKICSDLANTVCWVALEHVEHDPAVPHQQPS